MFEEVYTLNEIMINPTSRRQNDGRFAIILIAPLLPGHSESWRRFVQEMSTLRRHEYESSRRRLAISAESIWLTETRWGETAVIAAKTTHPEAIMQQIVVSEHPFDRWFCSQLKQLLKLEERRPFFPPVEMIWEWEGGN